MYNLKLNALTHQIPTFLWSEDKNRVDYPTACYHSLWIPWSRGENKASNHGIGKMIFFLEGMLRFCPPDPARKLLVVLVDWIEVDMSECEIANQEHAVELWRLLTIRPRSLAMRRLPSLFPGAIVVPNLKGLLDLGCSPAQPSTAIHFHKVHAAIMDTEAGAEEAATRPPCVGMG
jgi:hypothetical protein